MGLIRSADIGAKLAIGEPETEPLRELITGRDLGPDANILV